MNKPVSPNADYGAVIDVIASIIDGRGWAFLKVAGSGVQIDSTDIAQAIAGEFDAVLAALSPNDGIGIEDK